MAIGDRKILFELSKKCGNCGDDCIYTERTNGKLSPKEATIQHHYPVGDQRRSSVSLWCNECNQADNKVKQKGGVMNAKLFAIPVKDGWEIGYIKDLNHIFAFLSGKGYFITDRPTMMFVPILRKIQKDVNKRKQQAGS